MYYPILNNKVNYQASQQNPNGQDVIDRIGSKWVVIYADGTKRSSQYRWDLVRDEFNTLLTERAAESW